MISKTAQYIYEHNGQKYIIDFIGYRGFFRWDVVANVEKNGVPCLKIFITFKR